MNTSTTPKSQDKVLIPEHWRPEVECCIREKHLNDSSRNEIVRVLVSQLFSVTTKPTRAQCEDLGRKFIMKYPFSKDDLGNGYVSCVLFGLCVQT